MKIEGRSTERIWSRFGAQAIGAAEKEGHPEGVRCRLPELGSLVDPAQRLPVRAKVWLLGQTLSESHYGRRPARHCQNAAAFQ
jgi:hypothetical protein